MTLSLASARRPAAAQCTSSTWFLTYACQQAHWSHAGTTKDVLRGAASRSRQRAPGQSCACLVPAYLGCADMRQVSSTAELCASRARDLHAHLHSGACKAVEQLCRCCSRADAMAVQVKVMQWHLQETWQQASHLSAGQLGARGFTFVLVLAWVVHWQAAGCASLW